MNYIYIYIYIIETIHITLTLLTLCAHFLFTETTIIILKKIIYKM